MRDEATYIIMGSDVVAGHLPYLNLFENKPPGIFLALASVMSVFGENLLAVRLFSAVCLLVAAIAGYAIATRTTTPLVAGCSMAVFCAMTSESEFQPTLTEHLALAFLMPALWLLVAHRNCLSGAFLTGVLLSLATLTRTNIAFVVVAVGVFFAWRCWRPQADVPRGAIAAFGLGGALPLASLMLLYWFHGGLEVLLVSVFEVPLSYAASQLGPAETLRGRLANWMHYLRDIRETAYVFVPATLLAGVGVPAYILGRGRAIFRGQDGLTLLVLGATTVSILMSGSGWGYHLLQILPLVMIVAASGFVTLRRQPVGSFVFVGLALVTVAAGVGRFGAHSLERVRSEFAGTALYPRTERAAAAIEADRCCGQRVYAPSDHLVYWYLKQRPPSAVVHPTAIPRAALMAPLVARGYVSEDEQQRVLDQHFTYIVLDSGRVPTWLAPEHRMQLVDLVAEEFRPWKRVEDLVIYKRE